jgi:short subunit fatty acids transporter
MLEVIPLQQMLFLWDQELIQQVLVLVVLVVLVVKLEMQQMMEMNHLSDHHQHQQELLQLAVEEEVYFITLLDIMDQVDLHQEHLHLQGLEDLVEVVL